MSAKPRHSGAAQRAEPGIQKQARREHLDSGFALPARPGMTECIDSLVFDLVEWVAKEPRSYAQVMDAWRTSCPRLTVWEEAVDRGLVVRKGTIAAVTETGRMFVQSRSSLPGA